MGGSSSKTVLNQLSETITNMAMQTVQDCLVTADQEQNLNINNSGWNIFGLYKLKQSTDVSSTCFNDSQKQAELQNKIYNAISQASTAQGTAVLSAFGSSSSAAETNLKSIIKNNITMSNIQKNYNMIKQKQNANVNNSGLSFFTSVDMTQGAEVFAASTLQEVISAGIFDKIGTYVDQNSQADTTSPLNIFGDLFGSLGSSLYYLFIFIVVLVVGFVVYRSFFAAGDAPDTSAESPQQQQ